MGFSTVGFINSHLTLMSILFIFKAENFYLHQISSDLFLCSIFQFHFIIKSLLWHEHKQSNIKSVFLGSRTVLYYFFLPQVLKGSGNLVVSYQQTIARITLPGVCTPQ